MLKAKKMILPILFALSVSSSALAFCLPKTSITASANEANKSVPESNTADDGQVSPRGLYTSLSFSIDGGSGKMWVTAKNEFTLFPSTVRVIVQLYSSDTREEDYKKMTLVSSNSIVDLDMGKTIKTEASTNGKEKFWLGRMYYKIDTKSWEERIVGPMRCNANGDFISYT